MATASTDSNEYQGRIVGCYGGKTLRITDESKLAEFTIYVLMAMANTQAGGGGGKGGPKNNILLQAQ